MTGDPFDPMRLRGARPGPFRNTVLAPASELGPPPPPVRGRSPLQGDFVRRYVEPRILPGATPCLGGYVARPSRQEIADLDLAQ